MSPSIRLSVPLFRAEVERRLIDVAAVRALINRRSRQTVWDWVESGLLPPPILRVSRGYALWDADEVQEHLNGGSKP